MTTPRILGTPLSPSATKVMLLGSGELGKEVIISLQRLGVEVIAVDRYPNAPGHQVAHRFHVVDMTDGDALAALIEKEKPDLIVPEIEAIATPRLAELEAAGKITCIPTARAALLTMNREGIRRLAAEELGLATSPYRFASSLEELKAACAEIGFPNIVKPVMSSSGKGQSKLDSAADVEHAWNYAAAGGRVVPGVFDVGGAVQLRLALARRGHHRLDDVGEADLGAGGLQFLQAGSEAVGRRRQAQLFGGQAADAFAVHGQQGRARGRDAGDLAGGFQLGQPGRGDRLDLRHDQIRFFLLDERGERVAVGHVDHVEAVRDLVARRVRVAVDGDHFDAEALQRNDHFLAELAGTEQHDFGGGRGEGRAQDAWRGHG